MFSGIAPVHGLEHPAAARLERQVQHRRDLFAGGHGVEQPGAGVLGVAGHKPDEELTGNGVDLLQQPREIHAQVQVFPVGVDVLAQKRDVFVPGVHQGSHFVQDLLRLAAPFPSPDVGDDAVGAEVVTPVHDGHPALEPVLAHRRDALGHGADLIPGGKDALALGHLFHQQFGELPQQLRAKDQVHIGKGLFQPLHHVLLPGHAPADADDLPRMPPLRVGQGAHIAKDPLLRVFPHGAGVQQDQVGPLFRVGKGVPHPGQIAPQTLGVGFILLAAVGVNKGQLLAGAVLQQGMDLVAKGQLAVDLRRRDGHSLSQSRFLRVSAWQDL